MTDKIKEIRDRVEQDVAKGPANKEIYRVHKDRAFLLAEVNRLRRHVDALQEKVSAESCACGYDSPDAVCLAHSPQLSAALADVERLTRERDEARAEVDRLTRDRRERIATAALQGILACVENGIAPESWADFIPQRAVIYADALIAELDREAKP